MITLGKVTTETQNAKISFTPEPVSPQQYLPL
jgi:hypothetical protein